MLNNNYCVLMFSYWRRSVAAKNFEMHYGAQAVTRRACMTGRAKLKLLVIYIVWCTCGCIPH